MSDYELKKWSMPSNYFGSEWDEYYVFLTRTRDTRVLGLSNYIAALSKLLNVNYKPHKENNYSYITNPDHLQQFETKTVFTVRESHWAVGWVEWIAIHESDLKAIQVANQMIESISDYPLLDDEFYSYLELGLENELI